MAPPAEGDQELFTQSWFPITFSEAVKPGELKGFDFLDGRVIVVRDEAGRAQVLSGYCRHLGADLSGGEWRDGGVRCPFHYWRYDAHGVCRATGSGDPVPPTARLFRFPTVEKFGLIFAFNGLEPLFELPDLPARDRPLLWKVGTYQRVMHVDPWVVCCNTPDMQHIAAVHGIQFDGTDPHDTVQWEPHGMRYRLTGLHRLGQRIDFRVGIVGSNIYYQEGELDGAWFGFIAPMGLERPRQTPLYLIVAVEDDPLDPSGARQRLEQLYALEELVASEDLPIVENAHFRPGTLTRSDRTLSRFMRYLREYPRAHPSRDYIR